MDLASAYSAVRDLPDSALHKEMQSPSGMLPAYLVMGELSDRASIRGGMSNPKPPTIKDQLMAGTQQAQPQIVPGYSRGGIIGQLNPFIAQQQGLRNPDMAAGLAQDSMNSQNGGMMPLIEPQAPGAPGEGMALSAMVPLPPGNPSAIDSGGLATLLRSR